MVPSLAVAGVPLANLALLLGAFVLLLGGAEIFTNSVEWLGHHLGVSESATGSLLAAVGTALPETMIPVIAIGSVLLGRGDAAAADEIGVGAILGAPFMLATIAMALVGASVLYFGPRRRAGATFEVETETLGRDLTVFVVGYVLAVAAAFVPSRIVRVGIAVGLVLLYGWYVRQTLGSGRRIAGGELDALHLTGLLTEGERPFPAVGSRLVPIRQPPLWMVAVQTGVALLVIVAGAHLFVSEVEFFSAEVFDVPAALVALLLAPLATELPEKFNSVIWISEDKDTLAIGNITGAMVFQGTLPAALGILFTSWNLGIAWGTVGFLNALSAVLALLGAGLVLLRVRFTSSERMRPAPFLLSGLLYLVFIAVVIYHVVVLGVAAGGH